MEAIEYGTLIRTLTSNLNAYVGNQCESYGIKQGQFEYFLLIAWNPGINQLDIAKRKNVGKSAVTKALKVLEGDGFIYRISHPEDKRQSQCFLTEKGQGITPKLNAISSDIGGELFAGFSGEEKDLFYNLLIRLVHNSEELPSLTEN